MDAPASQDTQKPEKKTIKKIALIQGLCAFAIFIEITVLVFFHPLRAWETTPMIAVLASPIALFLGRKAMDRLKSSEAHALAVRNKVALLITGGLALLLLTPAVFLVANRLLDTSAPEIAVLDVTGKHISRHTSKSGHVSYSYLIEYASPVPSALPFGGIGTYTEEWSVRQAEYGLFKPGADTIEMEMHKGFFGIPWVKRTATRHAAPMTPDTARIADACRFTKHFNFEKDILAMDPTDWHRDYWASGNLRSEEPLVYGKAHGLAHYFFDNGKPYGQIPWKQGEKHGTFTLYRDDGTVEQKLSYKHGKPYGICEWYNPDGTLMQRALYLDNDDTAYDASQCDNYE